MAALAVTLLTLSSLLAGLTLALGGLDSTLLQLKSVTGTAKQRSETSSSLPKPSY
jgi:metal transporter CNNM